MTENIKLPDKGKTYGSMESGSQNPNEEEDDYDPHEHRVVEHPITNIEALCHIVKGSLGTGILAMPEAFKNSGYIAGSAGTIFLGALSVYCILLLIRSQYKLCKRHRVPILRYPDSMKLALEDGPDCLKFLSNPSVYIVDGVLIVYQVGGCCVYVIFIAENLKQVCSTYYKELDIKIFIGILFVPLLLISLIKNLKGLAPLSIVANILTFIGFSICLYYVFKDIPSLRERKMVAALRQLPLFFGTVLFALEAVGVVLALEGIMKNPKSFGNWNGVFNIGMIIIIIMYGGLGFCGYWRFGEESASSITLNLPEKDKLAISVRILFCFTIFVSYALQGYVPVSIVWEYLKGKYEGTKYEMLIFYSIRVGNVIITTLLAIAIPRLGLFISLLGAVGLSVLAFIFPVILEICTYWPNQLGPFKWILIKDIIIATFALLGSICGVYTCIHDIIESYQ